MDLDKVTQDEELKEKILQQLEKKGVQWNELNKTQQLKIVKGSKAAKKTVKKMIG